MTAKYPDNRDRRPAIGLYAGSFNPFTIGHKSIVERALTIFDKIIIGIGNNISKEGSGDDAIRLVTAIREIFAGNDRVEVISYSGLTVDFALQIGATALVRGVRGTADFEYERNLADVNRSISGLETVILFALPEHSYISSSMVRELVAFGHDPALYLP